MDPDCNAAKGLMNRAHAYKASVQANEEAGETLITQSQWGFFLPDSDGG